MSSVFLALMWLVVPYPSGALLFFVGAYAHWTLKGSKRGTGRLAAGSLPSHGETVREILEPLREIAALGNHPVAFLEKPRIVRGEQFCDPLRCLCVNLADQFSCALRHRRHGLVADDGARSEAKPHTHG